MKSALLTGKATIAPAGSVDDHRHSARNGSPTTVDAIRARLRDEKIDFLLAQYVDVDGTPRCKGVQASAFDLFVEGSAGFAGAAVSGMGQGPHDHDMIGIPDLDSCTPVPWERDVARFACDITVDGAPWPYCPRTVLKRAVEALAREGYTMMVGVCHFHISLWDAEARTNQFLDGADRRGLGLSTLGYQFLAGVMAHARALAAVVAPTVNDYKRLSVGEFLTGATSGFTWTPAFISYGDNNRTQMFRVPEPGRFECRLVSGAVNPYLGMAAFIAAGLDGIHRELDPGEPIAGRNMYTLTLDELTRSGLGLVPQSLSEALDAFEADPVVQGALGGALAAEFVRVKRQEWVKYHNTVSQWEIDRYLTLF